MKQKNLVMERYDSLGGSDYDMRYTEEQQAKYALILEELGDPNLLFDNGCGTGLLFPLIDCPLVGLDLSSGLLAKARERLRDHQYLVQGDSEHLPFRDKVFDAVVSVTVIQNLAEPRMLPYESGRVCRIGSTVIVSSLKRVYTSSDEIARLVESEYLELSSVFTDENINDWITVSTRKQ